MRWPLDKVFITQDWGNDLIVNGKHFYAQWGYKGHNGIDLRAANGTPVYAPHGGVVKERRTEASGYGNYLKIESKIEGSILAHLKQFNVGINKHVKEGDLIGWSDNTGASTAPHLHWGYYRIPRNRGNGYGGTIDPIEFIKNYDGGSMPSDDGLKECEDKYKKLDQEYKLEQQRLVDCRNDRDQLEQEIQRVRDEARKAQDDMAVRIAAAEAGLKAEKEAHNEIKRFLSNELNTTQNLSEIKAEVIRLVGIEDLLVKERKAHEATKDRLTDKDTTIKQLKNEIERLQGELKKAKGLDDASTVEMLQEIINRLKKLIRR